MQKLLLPQLVDRTVVLFLAADFSVVLLRGGHGQSFQYQPVVHNNEKQLSTFLCWPLTHCIPSGFSPLYQNTGPGFIFTTVGKSYSGCHHWSSHRLHPYSSEGLGRTSTNWEACRCSWSWCCFKAVLMFQGMCCVPSNPAIDTLILLHFKIEDLKILPPQLRPRPEVRPHDLKAFTSTSSSIYMVYLDWWPPKWDTAWKKPNGLINALKSTSGRSITGFHWECIHLGYRTSGISG